MKFHGALAALLLLFSVVACAAPVSFADLAKHPEYSQVKISPDGQYIAVQGMVKGQQSLALIRLSDMKGNLVRPREGDDVVDFWWASPKRVVYTVGEHVGGYDIPLSTGELFAVDADGGNAKLLYGYRKGGMSTGSHVQHATSHYGSATFLASIPDKPNYALVSVSSWNAAGTEGDLPVAYRMDLRSGDLAPVVKAPGRNMTFVADHKGQVRLSYGLDNADNLKVYRRGGGADGWQEMAEAESSRSYPVTFNRDDSLIYFTCAPKTGGLGLCTWSPKSDQWNTVWSNPDVAADSLIRGPAKDQIIGVGFEDGRPAAALFDSSGSAAKIVLALMQQFPGEEVRIVSGTTDGSRSIVKVSADVDPGTFYLYDQQTRKLTPLLAEAKWIDPARMAAKQPFHFNARDGLKLQGYISFPPGKEKATHLPTVVFVHGGPYGVKDDWSYDPYVQAMATRGYAVLQVNYRGSGGHGYNFEKAGWGEWGGKMQDDVTDATRWAITKGIADPQRICIFGGSYGGYAALEGAVKEPDLYKCAIGYVGVYDLPLMYRRGDIPQSSYGEDYLKRVLGTDMNVLAQRSPVNQLDQLKARVMLVVGGNDRRVPPVQGNELHNALLKRGINHVWIEKPGEMHGFYDEKNVAELFQSIDGFLQSSIGPGTVAAHSTGTATSQAK